MDFEEFYIKWFAKAKRFAETFVKDDAESIVQDVFLSMYEKWDLFDESFNIVHYFFVSLKHRCLDHLRKKAKRNEKIPELKEELNEEALESLDVDWKRAEEIDAVIHETLDSLPPHCRTIFTMSKFEGLKQKDIAAQLGISQKTVENQITIAFKKFKAALKNFLRDSEV